MNGIVRGILTAILCVALVGFGLCGAYGTLVGVAGLSDTSGEDRGIAQVAITYGLVGLAIAGACLFVVVRLQRKRPRDGA